MKAQRLPLLAFCVVLGIAGPIVRAQNRDHDEHHDHDDFDRHGYWEKHRASHWDSEHRTWEQRGGYNGYRVPDDRFTATFGPDHSFRINTLPIRVVNNEPYYQYNGYWMRVVDPWPESWPQDWYDKEDVYVVNEHGGYYLYNRRHPGIALSLEFAQ